MLRITYWIYLPKPVLRRNQEVPYLNIKLSENKAHKLFMAVWEIVPLHLVAGDSGVTNV